MKPINYLTIPIDSAVAIRLYREGGNMLLYCDTNHMVPTEEEPSDRLVLDRLLEADRILTRAIRVEQELIAIKASN